MTPLDIFLRNRAKSVTFTVDRTQHMPGEAPRGRIRCNVRTLSGFEGTSDWEHTAEAALAGAIEEVDEAVREYNYEEARALDPEGFDRTQIADTWDGG